MIKLSKLMKVLCYLTMAVNLLVMYLKILDGYSIIPQLIGVPLLCVAYKLICFCEGKEDN